MEASTKKPGQKKRGRPSTSHNVTVTPEFRREPDIEKLGRALIAIATDMARKRKAEEARQSSHQIQSLLDKDSSES